MTLTEIEAMEKAVLTCAEVAPVLMANPHTIHLQAVECPERLGFPVIVVGSRVKIPRIPFLMFMNGGKDELIRKGQQEHRASEGI